MATGWDFFFASAVPKVVTQMAIHKIEENNTQDNRDVRRRQFT